MDNSKGETMKRRCLHPNPNDCWLHRKRVNVGRLMSWIYATGLMGLMLYSITTSAS
jgi:hypothetical protein